MFSIDGARHRANTFGHFTPVLAGPITIQYLVTITERAPIAADGVRPFDPGINLQLGAPESSTWRSRSSS